MRKVLVLFFVFALFLATKSLASAQTGIVTATVRASPLKVEIKASPTIPLGSWFDIPVDVSNLGSQTIEGVLVSINNPTGLSIKGKKSESIGNLAPGGIVTVTWQAKTNTVGDYIMIADATGVLAGETLYASDSALLSTSGSLGAFLRSLIFSLFSS